MSQPWTERPLYIAIQYVYYFLMTNIHFMIANLIFIIAFIVFELTLANMIIFYIALLPAGPAIAALCATMGKLTREKEINPAKDFWNYYKKNFLVSVKYWLLKWSILAMLLIDLQYTNAQLKWLTPIIITLIVIFSLIMLYAFPILIRFEVKIKNLWLVSIYSNFKFFKKTLINLSTFVSLFIIYMFAPGITLWFFMSIAAFFIMLNMKKPLQIMEKELTKSFQTDEVSQ
ncbi:YesL family protein [Gracilibacillus xinjiangensis]|uniref:YesL family protein n=1 Tax=Gracilibacillus xinjiangensis TaxID=1193282 RepID=A0ABV8WQT1_9BACI